MAVYNQDGSLAVGKSIGRFAVDVVKISVAVAGGIAVYKLAENYLSGNDSAALPCGGAVPGIPESGSFEQQAAYAGYHETF